MKKKLLVSYVIILCLFQITHSQTIPPYVPTNGLLAWYPFNGNGDDISGNANNAANYGATFVADRNGMPNAAASTNGISQYLKVDMPGFIFSETGSFTFSLWVNKQTPSGSGVVMMHGTATAGNFIWNFQGKSEAQYGTNMQQSAWTWATCPHNLQVWDHYVGTYDNKIMNLYKNGFFQSTAMYPYTGATATTLPLFIGKGFSGNYYKGDLDDIGIWDRVLTQQEITTLYNSCDMTITLQPSDQQLKVGDNAEFLCAVSVTGAQYQWQQMVGFTWMDISNTGQYSGVNTDKLTVWLVTVSDNNNQAFRCMITSGTCIDSTNIAYLYVCGEITEQPFDTLVNINTNAHFSVKTNDTTAAYQWQSDVSGSFQDLINGGQYAGVKGDILSIWNVTMANHNQAFRCIIETGACIDTSDAAILTVDNNVGMTSNIASGVISLFPNPTGSKITLIYKNIIGNSEYKIYNQLGMLVMRGILESENSTIDLEKINKGVYFIIIGNQEINTYKILKK